MGGVDFGEFFFVEFFRNWSRMRGIESPKKMRFWMQFSTSFCLEPTVGHWYWPYFTPVDQSLPWSKKEST